MALSTQKSATDSATRTNSRAARMPLEGPPIVSARIAVITANSEAPQTKISLLRDMVSASEGASLAGLVRATGWQAHTVRAALSGLRKSGLVLICTRVDGETIYRNLGTAYPISPEAAGIALSAAADLIRASTSSEEAAGEAAPAAPAHELTQ